MTTLSLEILTKRIDCVLGTSAARIASLFNKDFFISTYCTTDCVHIHKPVRGEAPNFVKLDKK